jgi:molybdopterin/thiamine biosynthesis adenylyltransferase
MGHKKLTTDNPSDFYPDFLRKVKQRSSKDLASDRPVLIRMEEKGAQKNLETLIQENPNLEVIDNYDEQYAELLLSLHAHLYRANYDVQVASISKLLEDHFAGQKPWTLGTWVYFPWKSQLVHILAQKDFEDLRTIRNRDLILPEEQVKLFNFEAACFGMSVGSAGALALGISGISRRLKLVDGAVISGSNLNRILTGVSSVGQSKAVTIARQIYEMNPYSDIQNFDKVDAENIGEILDTQWQAKVVVDEIDDIEMKVRIRAEARARKIPVVMATELGDTVMLDVERYDLEPKRPLFHDMIPGVEKLLDAKVENYREWTKHAVGIIDPSNMPMKMQQSLLKIGNTIVTHPQLGSTVMVTGGILAFAVKSIALDHPLESGRYVISLEKELLADHKTRKYKRAHKKHTKVIKTAVKSM